MNPRVCQSITKKSASNLAPAFILLPPEKRVGMATLYAFCHEVDDVADDHSRPVEERRRLLRSWREDVRAACEGAQPRFPVNLELQPVIQTYRLPFEYFDELLKGVEMDLDISRYETYASLEHYCYRVASVVGLLSIEIFGYKNPACRRYAISLGKALQLTNILRDVRVDAERGRVYLPAEEMNRCGVSPEEVIRLDYSPRFQRLAVAVAQRARAFYQEARQALPAEDRRSMVAAELMGSVYWRLLDKLEAQQFNVFGPKVTRLGGAQKIMLLLRTWWRFTTGASISSYGAHS